jgi:hypothetical protein
MTFKKAKSVTQNYFCDILARKADDDRLLILQVFYAIYVEKLDITFKKQD